MKHEYYNGKNINFKAEIILFFSSWFFIGFAPFASGTFATITAIPICFCLSVLSFKKSFFFLVILVAVAIWTSDLSEKYLLKNDPKEIVIDEVVGMCFAMLGLPFTILNILLGFIFFRLIDILKPQPIKFIDYNIGGGFGVVFDDIVAGVISNIFVRFLIL